MKMKTILLVILFLLLPQIALANSLAPIFPAISVLGWIGLPLIILIETLFYIRKAIRHPVRLAVYSNLCSTLAGVPVAIVTFPFMIGPPIAPYLDAIIVGTAATIGGIVFHWWFSSQVEYRFSKRHKLWANDNLPLNLFYKANAITYFAITLVFAKLILEMVIKYMAKTSAL